MNGKADRCDRRRFLAGSLGGWLACSGLGAFAARAEDGTPGERPPVVDPRATSGDERHEPAWEQRLTISVGPKQADLVGETDRAIQAAVDYVAGLGGGTVRILAGTYRMRNSVHLRSRVRLIGEGATLLKLPSATTPLADDSDWYDQEITLADPRGFEVGDGVCLRSTGPDGEATVLKRTLVARAGNRFKLDRPLRKNLWLSGKATASTLFPILSGSEIADVAIEDLALDGNRGENGNLDGNHAGCVFLQDCNRIALRGLDARAYNGDGISWQICHDVVVEGCRSRDHAGFGLHPGSGSQRPVIRNNLLEKNGLGLYFCWGVKFGLAERNTIRDNRDYGISIGHCDTDNVIRDNVVQRSGKVGVLFRDDDRGRDFWPNRNRLERNTIADSGDAQGVAVDVRGRTREIVLVGNELREMRGAERRIGVRIGPQCGAVTLTENRLAGFAVDVQDERAAG